MNIKACSEKLKEALVSKRSMLLSGNIRVASRTKKDENKSNKRERERNRDVHISSKQSRNEEVIKILCQIKNQWAK